MIENSDFQTLKLERHDDHVLVVTMNRPEARNAKNTAMGREYKAVLEALYVNIATQVDRNSGYQFELEAYAPLVQSEDRNEGVRAFNERRKPQFKGR
jgi:enoyl-CoA hydratase/carnithine racemase